MKKTKYNRDFYLKLSIVFAIALSFVIMGVIGYWTNLIFGVMLLNSEITMTKGLLYPRESETREVKSLDGIWNFVKSDRTNPSEGIRDKWFKRNLEQIRETIPMPVPGSYNDITQDSDLRGHVGTVWYDRKFFIPNSWSNDKRVWIRFGSVHYEAYVWINGKMSVKHEFGHLPFEGDITNMLEYGKENRITVLCDNVLLQTTIPQGKVVELTTDEGKEISQTYTFDFFNYAGIHRSVMLYTTPITYIEDIIISTDIKDTNGYVFYEVKYNTTITEKCNNLYVIIKICDKNGTIIATDTSGIELKGVISIENVKPWWPYLMDPVPGYLYNMEVYLYCDTVQMDVYRQKIGIRTLFWDEKQFLINGRPIYFRGFGKHEDSDIRGKGLDNALITRDFNLLKWIGANAYRTSHYPYSEESMDFADEAGIMIIDECPSVDTENYSQVLLVKHKSSIEQLIHRDKNHPSVVMWSIANEPRVGVLAADAYFEAVATFTRSMDPTRPVTAAIATNVLEDKAGKHLDIISFNRYNGWYQNTGQLNMITNRVVDEAISWNKKYNKPVLMSEYGADTVEGLHLMPPFVWSEEYQEALLAQHFKAFDILRRDESFFIGEFVWNFADFKTAQTYTRVGGNKKGVFTRNRQPKAAAHLLRKRYFSLTHLLDNSTLPNDLFLYVIDTTKPKLNEEL